MRAPSTALLAAAALALSCAHAPQAPPAAERLVLPPPPAVPRVRLAGTVTLARPEGRAWWRTALRILTGVAPEDDAAGALARPFDVALRADGSFVVADPDRPGVLAYRPDGAFSAQLTCADHAWSAPMSVAVEDDGTVWVADAADAAIVRWTAAGCAVLRPAGLQRPTGIAIAGDRVVVADPPTHQLVALSRAGDVVARFGANGDGDGEFNFPTDVTAAPDGTLWVVDALNFRVVHLAADGRWIGAFGARGEVGAGLSRPKGIHADPDRVYVADAYRDAVLVFRPDGALEYVLGESGAAPGRFAHPAGLSARGRRLVVADSVNRRAQIFELLGEER